MLTEGYMNSRRLAILLHQEKIPFELVTVAPSIKKKRNQNWIHFIFESFWRCVKYPHFLRKFGQRNRLSYPIKEEFGGFLNSHKLIRLLQSKQPDYILMMGGGILSTETIQTAKKGVLNAHPALLPWIRGVDVIYHAIMKDIPIGVTCHFIDVGIDTGPIINRTTLPYQPNLSIEEINERVDHLSVAIMFNVIKKIVRKEKLPMISQQEKYPLCKKISPDKKPSIIQKLHSQNYNDTCLHFLANHTEIENGSDVLDQYLKNWGDKVS